MTPDQQNALRTFGTWFDHALEWLATRTGHAVVLIGFLAAAYRYVWTPWLKPNMVKGFALLDALASFSVTQGMNSLWTSAVFDHLHTPMFVTDRHGKCLGINMAAAKLLGISQHDALQYGWLGAILPHQQPTVKQVWENAITNKVHYLDTYTCINGNNIQATAKPYHSPNGEVAIWGGQLDLMGKREA